MLRTRVAAVISGALILGAGAASADLGQPDAGVRTPSSEGSSQEGDGWLAVQLDRVHLHKRSGLSYTRRVDRADRDLMVSVRGPAMARNRVGLSLEVRF